MTEQEAIQVLEKEKAYMDSHGGDTQSKALDMAIKALKCKYDCEIKHLTNECSYSETGCSDCRGRLKIKDALEKQIAKKPVVDTGTFYFYKPIPIYRCPMCNSTLERNQGHCRCGQRLNWEEES